MFVSFHYRRSLRFGNQSTQSTWNCVEDCDRTGIQIWICWAVVRKKGKQKRERRKPHHTQFPDVRLNGVAADCCPPNHHSVRDNRTRSRHTVLDGCAGRIRLHRKIKQKRKFPLVRTSTGAPVLSAFDKRYTASVAHCKKLPTRLAPPAEWPNRSTDRSW